MKKVGLKWTPAAPAKRPDMIISSRARENGESGFRPTYESEARENMFFIMSNEYMRIWFKERTLYEIDTYAKLEVESGAGDLKRRFVQRFMNKKRHQRELPPIKLKRFANVPAKTNTNQAEKA